MNVKDQRPKVVSPNLHGEYKRINDQYRDGTRRLDILPISSAKPTLPRVKFLEGKDDVK